MPYLRLRSVTVGRLGVLVDDHPDIFPVNYVVDGGTVVFRTAEGLKWMAVAAHPGVAFEADGYAADSRTAWSVVVKGHVEQVSKSDLLDTAALPLYPWHGEPKGRFVRVVPQSVTGRRFEVASTDASRTPLSDAPRTPLE